MFDVGFNRFLSLTAVSVAWVVALVLATLGLLTCVAVGIYFIGEQAAGWGVLWFLGGVVGWSVFLLTTRITLESVAVLFRIAESARTLVEQGRASAAGRLPYASTPVGHVEYGPRRRVY